MALFHFHVNQISRSVGSSAIASAAYRAGERLHSDRYDEVNDYTKKGGVRYSEIILAPQAPAAYADRETLWNAVEAAEKRGDAQLAYSFDISLQNEFTDEENLALTRQFILENFVSKGMTVDFAVHDPDREPGGISNPHIHVMAPIRPIEADGSWGCKQHKVKIVGEDGRVTIRGMPTTDWGSPETLETWRKNWADLCNSKFAEKGLDVRIDHRSYERQGMEQIAQVHEGPTVRAMEKKGILTEKGAYNRWVKATNAVLKSIYEKLVQLTGWIKEVKAELEKPEIPTLQELLVKYMEMQKEGAKNFSRYGRQKATIVTLKDVCSALVYLQQNSIDRPNQFEAKLSSLTDSMNRLKDSMKEKSDRMKVLKEAIGQVKVYQENIPVYREMAKPKYRFKKAKDAYREQHDGQLRLFYRARRVIRDAGMPDHFDPAVLTAWKKELTQLEAEYSDAYSQLKPVREEQQKLSHIRYCVDRVMTAEQQLEQAQQKKKIEIEI